MTYPTPKKKKRTPRICLGNFGELVAATHLIRQGYTILDRKWRCCLGELDLVACQGEDIVFVEVRARRGTRFGTGEESISQTKRDRLITLAYSYLESHDLLDHTSWRIDVIAVEVDRAGCVVRFNHIPYAIEEE